MLAIKMLKQSFESKILTLLGRDFGFKLELLIMILEVRDILKICASSTQQNIEEKRINGHKTQRARLSVKINTRQVLQ